MTKRNQLSAFILFLFAVPPRSSSTNTLKLPETYFIKLYAFSDDEKEKKLETDEVLSRLSRDKLDDLSASLQQHEDDLLSTAAPRLCSPDDADDVDDDVDDEVDAVVMESSGGSGT